MKVTILGCGTSSGVPRIGNDWGDCDPSDPRNRRTRASILVQSSTTTILVDSGPDMRTQLLAANISAIDAVIWTHEHADHTHGIDDLRQLFHVRRAPVPGYGSAATMAVLEDRFGYVFAGRYGYPPTTRANVIDQRAVIGNIEVSLVDQPHGEIVSSGLRFECGDRAVGYATDFHEFTPAMESHYAGLDLWIVDALRKKAHPSHPHLALTLDAIARLRPKRALLTHMDQSMDFSSLATELPDGVAPAYDGLVVENA